MPEKTYKVGNEVYDNIPDNEVDAFLKEFPDAVEVQTFLVGKDTLDIPIAEVDAFLSDTPNAKPLRGKKKWGRFNGVYRILYFLWNWEPLDQAGKSGSTHYAA